MNKKPAIGVLGIQGSREEHEAILNKLGFEVIYCRSAEDLDKVSGIILPGGESTAIGKLLEWKDMKERLITKIKKGMPAWGTCAGAILLGKGGEYSMGLMDLEVERNAYGRQVESFVAEIEIPKVGKGKFEAVFIRAPRFIKVGKGVEVLAKLKGEPIFVRQGNMLATSFHPELTDDTRVHELFGKML